MEAPKRVAIIGGGISGLSAAYYLAKRGAEVSLFEASSQLGGLGTFFEFEGKNFERFYHCMLPSDDDLLHLLGELSLRDDTYWCETAFGYYGNKKIFPLNTAFDLLRFQPLSFVDRIRVGLTGLYGSFVSDKGLDDITAVDWLTKLSGKKAFHLFWKPLLQAKFGDRYEDVPALWFWTRFNREKGTSKEEKGYIRGGYHAIISRLLDSLETLGVRVACDAPVTDLELSDSGEVTFSAHGKSHTCDKVVITTPLPALQQMSTPNFREKYLQSLDTTIDMQGVINVLLLLKKSVSPFYWVATTDASIPFQGVVETSTIINADDRNGHHLAYLMNYTHRTSDLFNTPSEELLQSWTNSFLSLFPHIERSDIAESFIFKAPFVEPIYTRGYLKKRPPTTLVSDKVFLITTTQVYPTVTSWNGAVKQVRSLLDTILPKDSA